MLNDNEYYIARYRGPQVEGIRLGVKRGFEGSGAAFQNKKSAIVLKTEQKLQNELEARTGFAPVYWVLQTHA
jgi:hypothetical protein